MEIAEKCRGQNIPVSALQEFSHSRVEFVLDCWQHSEIKIHLVVMVTHKKHGNQPDHSLIILSSFFLSSFLHLIAPRPDRIYIKTTLPPHISSAFVQQITFYFPVHHPDLASYHFYQSSPFLPYPVFISAPIQSSLYIRHHNNHKCSDRFAGTAERERERERWSLRGREWVREKAREREPPTHPKTLHQ